MSSQSAVNVDVKVAEIVKSLKRDGKALQDHQIVGIKRMLEWANDDHGGILADEMGLGKTCQSICVLRALLDDQLFTKQGRKDKKKLINRKFGLILCPLSVLDHWKLEIERFGGDQVKAFCYYGIDTEREKMRKEMQKDKSWNILLAPYHTYHSDYAKIDIPFDAVVLDEAHKVKNSESQLHNIVAKEAPCRYTLLMTGTPVQNNLGEFYALLQLISPEVFSSRPRKVQAFLDRFADLTSDDAKDDMKDLLNKYVLRRTKAEVKINIPASANVVLLHHLTALQKRLYLGMIQQKWSEVQNSFANLDYFKKNALTNVIMNLRKCVIHPYLFQGVEPEPFKEGEHIVEASGKLQVLETLLRYLKRHGHRAIIYSQFTSVLDILEDFFHFRGYSYFRIDGRCKAEDRFASVDSFQDQKADFFLLSTKAGGVGLTLTAADTVIFVDSDWNPQNDLQAAARAHRIGQTKPVNIIRLLAKDTIEYNLHCRAMQKLKLTERFFDNEEELKLSGSELNELIVKGLNELSMASTYNEALTDQQLESFIGSTDKNGKWVLKEDDVLDEETNKIHMTSQGAYLFNGQDYHLTRREKEIIKELDSGVQGQSDPIIRRTQRGSPPTMKDVIKFKKDEEERKKANAKKRQAAQEEIWRQNNYTSTNLPLIDDRPEMVFDNVNYGPHFIYGDVMMPDWSAEDKDENLIIAHSLDNSGQWGNGGLFTRLKQKSDRIPAIYEKAAEMNDIMLGSAHIIENVDEAMPLDEDDISDGPSISSEGARKESVVLMVTQGATQRAQKIMKLAYVKKCFDRISHYAVENNARSIHMANFWHDTQNLQKSAVTEALVDYFTCRGIHVYVYTYSGARRVPFQKAQNAQKRKQDKKDAKKDGAKKAKTEELNDSNGENTVC
ncbi:hypothetical protein L596_013785 [Steinernema carpocapsae]|uniref:Uncharacterized protein n=1 Tax=Steinernema carpocapsae TaxID=34508 RepID=A0A4U5P185_STECR|nr:hypothetical protein L596_013785 [Steinernema carpocapsae]